MPGFPAFFLCSFVNMKWSLSIEIPSTPLLDYRDSYFLIGSCFTENMGAKLEEYGLSYYANPNGIVFNPHSIAKSCSRVMDGTPYQMEDLVYDKARDLHFCYDHHGSFSHSDSQKALTQMNRALVEAKKEISKAKIIVTLGTAWVYEHVSDSAIVANCHKQEGSKFRRRKLSVEEVLANLNKIRALFPDQLIIWTLSPIRHIKDGVQENSRSKAVLLEAIHQQVENSSNCHYFPAYEIMMDELRDYRFYSEDMIHPNQQAKDYIWRRFCESYLNDRSLDYMRETESLLKSMAHKPLHPDSAPALKFETGLDEKINSHNKKWQVNLTK